MGAVSTQTRKEPEMKDSQKNKAVLIEEILVMKPTSEASLQMSKAELIDELEKVRAEVAAAADHPSRPKTGRQERPTAGPARSVS